MPQPWTYDTTVDLAREDGAWRPDLVADPGAARPGRGHRLSQHRLYPARGELLGEDGDAIVKKRSVVRIGIDKANLAADRQEASATPAREAGRHRRQALRQAGRRRRSPGLRPGHRLPRAGPRPTGEPGGLRDPRRPAHPGRRDAGADARLRRRPGRPRRPGDRRGRQGLGRRRHRRRRGRAERAAEALRRTAARHARRRSCSSSPARGVGRRLPERGRLASRPPSPSASPSATTRQPTTAFEVKAVAGKPLETTLNVGLQQLAEKTLGEEPPAARRSSPSGPRRARSSPPPTTRRPTGSPVATSGQVQPGSTFKVDLRPRAAPRRA